MGKTFFQAGRWTITISTNGINIAKGTTDPRVEFDFISVDLG